MKASAGLLAFIIVSAVASAHAQDITTESSQSADDRLVNATVLPVPAEEGEATLSNSTDNNITTTTQSSSTPVGGVGDRDDSDTDNDGVVQPVTAGPGSGNHAFIRDSIAVEDTILSPTEGAIVEGEADESVSPSEEQSAADSDDSNRQAPDLFPSSQETNTETSTVHEEPRTDSNPSSEGSTDAAVNHGTGATVDDSKPSITGRGNRKTKKYFEQIGPLRAHVSGGDENVVGSRGDISRDQSLVDDSVDADSDDNIETRVIEPLSVSAGDDTHNSSTAEGDGTGIDDNNVDDDLQSSRTTEGDGTDTDDNIVVDETHGSSTTRSDDANNDDSNVAPPQDDDVSAQRSNGAGLGRGSAVIEDTIVSPTDGAVGSDNADDNSRSYNVSEEYSTGDDVTNSNGQKTDVSRSPQNTNKEMHDPKPDTDAYPPPEDSTDASTETVDVIRQTKGRYFDQIGPLGAKLIEGEDDTDGDADNTVGADSDDGGEDDDDNTVGADSDDGGEDDDDNTVGADSDDGGEDDDDNTVGADSDDSGEDDDDNTVGADSDDGGKDDADNTVGADSDDGGEDDNDDTGEDDTSEINADDVNESANSNIDSRSSSQDADETETVNVGSLVDKMTGNDGKNDDTGSDSGNDARNDGDTSSNSDDDDVPADGSDDVPSNPRFSPVMMAEERARRRPADWQEWGAWSECTACGGCGSRQRSRECMLGARGQTCEGESEQTDACGPSFACPSGNPRPCQVGTAVRKMRAKFCDMFCCPTHYFNMISEVCEQKAPHEPVMGGRVLNDVTSLRAIGGRPGRRGRRGRRRG